MERQTIIIDPATISNPVLKRLIEEVNWEKDNNIAAYNRTHNRHNRSREGSSIPATTTPTEQKPSK